MSEEYLWDKSGEPDLEIQQLEEILGSLRYQPQPLKMPDQTQPQSRTSYLPWLTIAATLLLVAFAGLLWFRWHNNTPAEKITRATVPNVPSETPIAQPKSDSVIENKQQEKIAKGPELRPRKQFIAANTRRVHQPAVVPTAEALQAKEQLMTALRLASEKLNLAQRKAQGPAVPNQIRNQHKLG